MAWAVFTLPFNFDRRPAQAIAFSIQASEQPQQWPRDVVDAAIAAGKATEAEAPGKPPTRRKTKA